MKITTKILSSLSMILFFSFLVFSLSSKSNPSDFYDDPRPCDQIIDEDGCDARINIGFLYPANNPYRNTSYEDYIPQPDLRNGNFPGGTSLGERNNYYCTILVTANDCDWEWRRVFDSSNGNSSGDMTIKLPPSGYDFKLYVTYYERGENAPNTPNFNNETSAGQINGRVYYRFEKTYFGGWCGLAPLPIKLTPSGMTVEYDLPVDVWGGGGSKGPGISDFNSVNDFLDSE